MFIACACTVGFSSRDAVLVLQAEELAGALLSFCPLSARFCIKLRAGAKWVSVDELESNSACRSVSAAITRPAAAWIRSRIEGDGSARPVAVIQAKQLGEVSGASVFFSSCL
jgi:hypothetical protein